LEIMGICIRAKEKLTAGEARIEVETSYGGIGHKQQ
jgi:hypothetical protein